MMFELRTISARLHLRSTTALYYLTSFVFSHVRQRQSQILRERISFWEGHVVVGFLPDEESTDLH
jgi:hypothetical protein